MWILENTLYIAVLWYFLKTLALFFSLVDPQFHNSKNKMSTPKPPDKTTPAKNKAPPTADTTSPDEAAKPTKKTTPKTPQTVSDQKPDIPDTKQSFKSQSIPDSSPTPRLKVPSSPSGDGTKRILKKKPRTAVDQPHAGDSEQAKQHQDGVKPVKGKPKPPAVGNGDFENPAGHTKEHAHKEEPKSSPRTPKPNDPPKVIKKIREPAPPPDPEPEPERQDLESQPEDDKNGQKEPGCDDKHSAVDTQDTSVGKNEEDRYEAEESVEATEEHQDEETSEDGEEYSHAGELEKSTNSATRDTKNTAGDIAHKVNEAPFGQSGRDALNGVKKQTKETWDKANGRTERAGDKVTNAPITSKGIRGDSIADPDIVSDSPTNTASKAAGALSQVRGKLDSAGGQDQDKASVLAGKAKEHHAEADTISNGAKKQGTDAAEQLACNHSQDMIKGLVGKTVNDSGEVVDKSGQVVGKASGDLSLMAGNGVNDSGQIIDSGKVVGRVSETAGENKGQDAKELVDGFMPESGGSQYVKAGGIQISVQTTREGMSLTINIPGRFQQ